MLLEEGAICQDVRAGLNVNCVARALSGDIREESGAVFASESVAGDGLDDASVDVARATIFFVELEEIQGGGFVRWQLNCYVVRIASLVSIV